MKNWERKKLEAEHRAEAIKERIRDKRGYEYLGDAVLGGIDGCVTTFAIAAGAIGGGLPGFVVVILGFANLLSDGFSMAVSNYMRAKSDRDRLEETRHMEERHIELIPEGERQEIRQIFVDKGFSGEVLEKVVAGITQDKGLWVKTMLTEEHGLQIEGPVPIKASLITFGSFIVLGIIPLIPFLFRIDLERVQFLMSAAITACTFLIIGIVRGFILGRPALRSGILTLLTGGGAASIAFLVGSLLSSFYGAI